MHLIWILIAMPLASLLYFAWVVGRQRAAPYTVLFVPASRGSDAHRSDFAHRKRTIRWISSEEFGELTHKFEDVIFVDVLPRRSGCPQPFPGTPLLLIKPDEFCDVLRWAPPSNCVVLYGPSDLCKSMIRSARNIGGHAPVFVLPIGSGW
jgi:hypothetical protein